MINISNVGRTNHNLLLLHEAEAISFANCTEMKVLLKAMMVDGKMSDSAKKLLYTVMLGFIFTAVQAYEYYHAPFALGQGIYPSTFFVTTGFHGIHVILGAIFLLVILLRMKKGQIKPHDHMGFEAAAWYWHFVDVVWLFLFVFIYIWGR